MFSVLIFLDLLYFDNIIRGAFNECSLFSQDYEEFKGCCRNNLLVFGPTSEKFQSQELLLQLLLIGGRGEI